MQTIDGIAAGIADEATCRFCELSGRAADGLEYQLVLALEVVTDESAGEPRVIADHRDGNCRIAFVSNTADCSFLQIAAALDGYGGRLGTFLWSSAFGFFHVSDSAPTTIDIKRTEQLLEYA
jgi:hypothetical protein